MWLRNKKTGRVFDVIVREKSNGDGEYSIIVCNLRAIRRGRSISSILGEYDSLAKLYEEWEDSKPASEPLIEDEKVRKTFKTWAEINGFCGAKYSENSDGCAFIFEHYDGNNTVICFGSTWLGLEKGKSYTTLELCGGEE